MAIGVVLPPSHLQPSLGSLLAWGAAGPRQQPGEAIRTLPLLPGSGLSLPSWEMGLCRCPCPAPTPVQSPGEVSHQKGNFSHLQFSALQQYLSALLPSFTTFSVSHPMDWGGREEGDVCSFTGQPCRLVPTTSVPGLMLSRSQKGRCPPLVWVFALLLPVPLPQIHDIRNSAFSRIPARFAATPSTVAPKLPGGFPGKQNLRGREEALPTQLAPVPRHGVGAGGGVRDVNVSLSCYSWSPFRPGGLRAI